MSRYIQIYIILHRNTSETQNTFLNSTCTLLDLYFSLIFTAEIYTQIYLNVKKEEDTSGRATDDGNFFTVTRSELNTINFKMIKY